MARYGMSNVPDDWNCYWNKCPRCGKRYHASEGGCSCIEDAFEDCQCGMSDWGSLGINDEPICKKCGTGPYHDGRQHRAVHRARKPHGNIRPGDRYLRTVQFGYWPGGASTLKVTRVLIEKGPAWGE